MDAKDRRIAEQDREIAELKAELKAALENIAQLEAKIASLTKNSANSSKPPSSDIVKPPKQPKGKGKRKRKIGAQKGHKQNLRTPFDENQIDQTVELQLEACPKCGGELEPTNKPPKKHQQVELIEKPFIVTEYQQAEYWCEKCQCYHTATLPTEVQRAGLFGQNLIALTAYLKGRSHMSFTTLQDFFADVLGLKVSTGFLAKQVRKASDALASPYDNLVAQLKSEDHLHSDETGGKENGKRRWTWCLRASDFTVFHIDPSRGHEVLIKLLGKDFAGKISCDFFPAYQRFAKESKAELLLCWAHLIREVKFLAESKDKKVSRYGNRLLDAIGKMFKTIHCRDKYQNWFRRMKQHQKSILKAAWYRLPKDNKDAWNIAVRLWNEEESYFRFIEEDLPPTNNLCEQSIRRVVLNRKITQGTRSDWANRWWERIWSVLATCEQQGKNVMEFLMASVGSFLQGFSPPVLREG
ncbi:MAG: IS66 family transposase [Planctomycetaceae bacterium]|nr:IS66 family transposase [Planctomycetaceae bacterium]